MEATLANSMVMAQTQSKGAVLTGRALSGVVIAFLLFDAAGKLAHPDVVVQATVQLGIPESLITPIGIILLAFTALFAIPQTALVGAVCLTGYLGGAVLANLRMNEPLFSHTLFPIYFAALLWTGLYLREPRLRALAPLRR